MRRGIGERKNFGDMCGGGGGEERRGEERRERQIVPFPRGHYAQSDCDSLTSVGFNLIEILGLSFKLQTRGIKSLIRS